MKPARLVIVEDHTMVRQLLSDAVRIDPGLQIAAAVGSVAAGLAACLAHKPDLAIVDWMLPDGSGLTLVQQAQPRLPHLRFIMVTSNDQEHVVREASETGVQGFVFKRSSLETFREAVAAVLQGQRFYCPESSQLLLAASRSEGSDPARGLTPREREILRAVAGGLGTKEIAGRLDVSAKTVANHLATLKEKLQIHEMAGLVRYAIKHGFADTP
ncbi:MAG TPA: response regulator transcription factor [Opitutaceae bacterium]|nr:response regulator transcription factor [Opitutaceae bacterium]